MRAIEKLLILYLYINSVLIQIHMVLISLEMCEGQIIC